MMKQDCLWYFQLHDVGASGLTVGEGCQIQLQQEALSFNINQ